MGGQTDSQVDWQVAKSRKFHAYHWLMRLQITCDQLLTCAGWSNGKNLASTQVNASPRKSLQVDASGWPNETQVQRKSKTCVDLGVRLAWA